MFTVTEAQAAAAYTQVELDQIEHRDTPGNIRAAAMGEVGEDRVVEIDGRRFIVHVTPGHPPVRAVQ
ncbi:hypothetical protein [Demequina silvatica]|uniref:hypothetical protein n=1 Tax=Demequina silvatica TaxID=1638988 RepID=UPI0012E0A701|nr:hypothetical protein [Demequina silvatica]